MTATHYELLGVGSTSTPEQIRLAYLRKARENHPDKVANSDPARLRERQSAMVAINAAWFVLRDPDRRRLYDQELERAAECLAWEEDEGEEDWLPETEFPYDWTKESAVPPPEYGTHGNPAAAIARLYLFVVVAVFILLSIAFAYAVVRSGSVGVSLPE